MWAGIRDQASRLGVHGQGLRRWAAWVEAPGDEPPTKGVDRVLREMRDEGAAINGHFLWIADGLKGPMASWS